MAIWEGAMDKPYYSAEILSELTDSIVSLMGNDRPDDESVFHFFKL